MSFGWFALALDMLFSLGLVDLHHDLLVRRPANAA
ncbi:ABC-three component system middle component 6 [Agromyces tardus]